ncbi:MAG: hypothetical protein DRG27_03560 [Deltaproteobacteria bacterium]|nr:MAG: hypothetical protein DRG27_03560 [Deltaproteobacteria bacterium]
MAGKLDELGDDFDQEYPATPDRAFQQSVEGTYFHHQYRKILDQRRIGYYPHNPHHKVHVSFDLGINDEMVLLFVQIIDSIPYLINEYHNTGQGLEFYADVIKALPYDYDWFILPHDANVRDLSTGLTRIETLRKLGIVKVKLLEKLPFLDSINASRVFMKYLHIHEKCENTVLGIQNYRKKYDRQIGAYLSTDVHDIHSNYMASLRYMAQGLGYYSLKVKPHKEKKNISINFNSFAI